MPLRKAGCGPVFSLVYYIRDDSHETVKEVNSRPSTAAVFYAIVTEDMEALEL